MDYSSSYAAGTPRPGYDTGRRSPYGDAAETVLPAPPPQRMHWSTLVFLLGMTVCLAGLLATLAGAPAHMGYDGDSAGARNNPTSSDPMALTKSLDANMKWIDHASSDAKGSYVYYIKSINRSEAAIPALVQALAAMDASVRSMDAGMTQIGANAKAMRADMEAMTKVSGESAASMTALGGDIGFLSRSMLDLADSTKQLTTRMAAIEKKAGAIAAGGTATALKSTRSLNASMPSSVPAPIMSDGKPMPAPATGGGVDAPADAATEAAAPSANDMPPRPGAQPPRPLSAYETGAIL